jgi:DNA-binding transcriptional regulator PaaX
MAFWENIKEDLKLGMKEGIDALKLGAEKAREKAGEITDEGKKRYKIYNLKKEAMEQMAELGSRMYELEKENPGFITDEMAKTTAAVIKKLEAEIVELEAAKR